MTHVDAFQLYRQSRPGPRQGGGVAWAVLLAGAVIAGVLWYHAWPRVSHGGIVGLSQPGGSRFPDGVLTVVQLDVGQGDATFIHTPGGYNVLIDVGEGDRPENEHSRQYPATKHVVIPFLDLHRIYDIDLLIMTHPDSDHGGGMADLIEWLYERGGSVRLAIDPGMQKSAAFYREFLEAVDRHKVKYASVLDPATGQAAEYPKDLFPGFEGGTLVGKDVLGDPTCAVQIVGPIKKVGGGEDVANPNSVVTRIQCGDFSFLLAGDADEEAEDILISHWGTRLRSTVHFAAHHGSKTGINPNWYRIVSPEIIGVSAHPPVFGHPAGATLEAYKAYIVPPPRLLLRTDLNGDIWYRTDGAKFAVRTQFPYRDDEQWVGGKRGEWKEYRRFEPNAPTTWEDCKPVPGTDEL